MTTPLDENWLPPNRYQAKKAEVADTSKQAEALSAGLLVAVLLAPLPMLVLASQTIRRCGATPWVSLWAACWTGLALFMVAGPLRPTGSGETARLASGRAAVDTVAASREQMDDAEGIVLCQRLIEMRARWDYEWTGFLGSAEDVTYSRSLRTDGKAELTVRGAGLRLQNGFGAWSHHYFSCTFETRSKRPVAIEIF